jgi:hypothetical protein
MPARRARLLALSIALALGGCGAPPPTTDPSPLLHGALAPISPGQFEHAAHTARRFAVAYARSIYDPSPPQLPALTRSVAASLATAAVRVPPARVGRDAHLAALRLTPVSKTRLEAGATIADGRSTPFTVGFALERRGGRWLITAISPPG